MKKRRKSLILGIILVIFGLGIGYAFLTTNLNINGIADIDSNTWNVYWDNVNVTTGSMDAETPVIDTNKTTVTFNVHLSKPGDFYEFTVDAVNDGTIDAMIEIIHTTINGETTIPNYLNYTVEYADGAKIDNNHLLEAGSNEKYRVRVEYRSDINPSDLPATPQSLNIVFGVDYLQGDDTATNRFDYLYTINMGTSRATTIGEEIPSNITTYSSAEAAMSMFSHPLFIKHALDKDGIVRKSYVGMNYNGNIILIQGGDDGDSFEKNKAILTEAFGEEQCGEVINFTVGGYWSCRDTDQDLMMAAFPNGRVFVQDSRRLCYVREEKTAYCLSV